MPTITNPFVTLILPVRNESGFIEGGLQAVAEQDYPLDRMEVLIVDGKSTDDTREITLRFAKSHPELKVRILDNPGKIVPTGMNIALRKARGEIIVRVDGHCLIAPDYVRNCV
jgi:glycosyltransferase involved in cell wall biosynthesis